LEDDDADGLKNFEEAVLGTSSQSEDTDGDGYSDRAEFVLGTWLNEGLDPFTSNSGFSSDRDSDAMPDVWEVDIGLNVFVDDRNDDLDLDGLSNISEITISTRVDLYDTDNDDLSDGFEVTFSAHSPPLDPLIDNSDLRDSDSDTDNLSLFGEQLASTDPTDDDSDDDGHEDGDEVNAGSDPASDEEAPNDVNGQQGNLDVANPEDIEEPEPHCNDIKDELVVFPPEDCMDPPVGGGDDPENPQQEAIVAGAVKLYIKHPLHLIGDENTFHVCRENHDRRFSWSRMKMQARNNFADVPQPVVWLYKNTEGDTVSKKCGISNCMSMRAEGWDGIEKEWYEAKWEEMEVRFPTAGEILEDETVQKAMKRYWENTKDTADTFSGTGRVAEYGAFIYFNSETNSYEVPFHAKGPVKGPADGLDEVQMNLTPPKKETNPYVTPDKTGTFIVAAFHTHPPLHHWYQGNPFLLGSGPSEDDMQSAQNLKMGDKPFKLPQFVIDVSSGIVYDQNTEFDSPGYVHIFGYARRSTTGEKGEEKVIGPDFE